MKIAIGTAFKFMDATHIMEEDGVDIENAECVYIISAVCEEDKDKDIREFGDLYCCVCGKKIETPPEYYVGKLEYNIFDFVVCDNECEKVLDEYMQDNWVIVRGFLASIADSQEMILYNTTPVVFSLN